MITSHPTLGRSWRAGGATRRPFASGTPTGARSLLALVSAAVLLSARACPARAAEPIRVGTDALALTFDPATGALLSIDCAGRPVARGRADLPAVTFATGPADKPRWLEQAGPAPKLVGHATPSPDVLELTIAAGPYEWTETYKLHRAAPRLDRSLRLVYRGTEPEKLRSVAFRTPGIPATGEGFYRFPAQWPPRSHPYGEMQPGRRQRGSRSSIAPALAQLSPARTLLWAAYTDDSPSAEVVEGKGEFEMRQVVQAAGHLRPDQPQDVGFVSLTVVEGDYWAALGQLWPWMDSVGLRVPADRPAWVADAVLYSFHPGGTIGSQFRDLGGFEPAAARLLPTLPRLGVNAVWVMPVEYRSPYWPLDYYRFMDGLGTADQYKAMIAKAHALGLHVLQDLVPHGGAPQAVHNQAHPEFMLRREDGSTLDYWLNDFALPAWQKYVAAVAAHYVREYDVDGYRVDACYGSKEMNWAPDVPYPRASLAQLRGGLDMLAGIRGAVRGLRPDRGAILAEVESARHQAVSDFVYDFGFCYTLCPAWRKMEPAAYAAALQEYLEEQKYAEPRGALRLRHVESHDSLRSQLMYGVRGLRAFYALSAWTDGVPLVYHGQEVGHAPELAAINQARRERPELARGEALYRAVGCDAPGVFACLRRLGKRTSVVAINFNREPVTATLSWTGGKATIRLEPLGYAVLPRPEPAAAPAGAAPAPVPAPAAAPAPAALDDVVPFDGATEWFVDTLEGRLRDQFTGPRESGQAGKGSIFWRPQGTGTLWQNQTVPLDPASPQLGFRGADGTWQVLRFDGPVTSDLRLVERLDGKPGLHLLGAKELAARRSVLPQLPAAREVTEPAHLGGVTLRCAGSQYVVANRHFEVVLQRQGGVIRHLRRGPAVLAEDADLYGDQEQFAGRNTTTIRASDDVECGIRAWTAPDGLHLAFEGQLRGSNRFALHRPPVWFRNEYVFSDSPRFTQAWAFRAEKGFADKKAFLTAWVSLPAGDAFRFLRGGRVLAEDRFGPGPGRRGQTAGRAVPDALLVLDAGRPVLALADLAAPDGGKVNVFTQGRRLFVTLLDGRPAAMEEGQWYGFRATWDAAPQASAPR